MDSNFRFRVPCKGRKAIIAGFGCMPPSVDYLRLPSVDITEGGLSEISEPKPYRARNRGFESISLHWRVCRPLVPQPASEFGPFTRGNPSHHAVGCGSALSSFQNGALVPNEEWASPKYRE